MKRTLLSLVVLSTMFASSAVLAAEEGTAYFGIKAGYGHLETDSHRRADNITPDDKDFVTGGAYVGYNITSFLGVEAGYDYLGSYSYKLNNKSYDKNLHGAEFAALIGIPFNKTDDVFFKLGGLLSTVNDDLHDSSATKLAPLVGIGTRVALTDLLGLRLEYQYAHKVADIEDYGYAPDLHNVNLGLEFRFGGAEEAPAPKAEPAPTPKIVERSVTLDSTALFNFSKASLTEQAKSSLKGVATEVSGYNLKDMSVVVEGHTDRIGSASSNQKLSDKRSQAVASELVAQGINSSSIKAVGYGETKPVTGNKCDSLKGQKLVNCLAPDRRVEIKVSGVQEVTE